MVWHTRRSINQGGLDFNTTATTTAIVPKKTTGADQPRVFSTWYIFVSRKMPLLYYLGTDRLNLRENGHRRYEYTRHPLRGVA